MFCSIPAWVKTTRSLRFHTAFFARKYTGIAKFKHLRREQREPENNGDDDNGDDLPWRNAPIAVTNCNQALLFERQTQSEVTIDMLTLTKLSTSSDTVWNTQTKGSGPLRKLLLFCNVSICSFNALFPGKLGLRHCGHVNYYGSFTASKIDEIQKFKRNLKDMIIEKGFAHFFAQADDVKAAGVSEEILSITPVFQSRQSPGSLEPENLWRRRGSSMPSRPGLCTSPDFGEAERGAAIPWAGRRKFGGKKHFLF